MSSNSKSKKKLKVSHTVVTNETPANVGDDANTAATNTKMKSNYRGGNKKTNNKAASLSKPLLTSSASLSSLLSNNGIGCSGDDSNEIDDYIPGTKIIVTYRDGSHRIAKVIDRSRVNNAETTVSTTNVSTNQLWQYYIHYDDFNRRMDEWIDANRIISIAPSVDDTPASLNHDDTLILTSDDTSTSQHQIDKLSSTSTTTKNKNKLLSSSSSSSLPNSNFNSDSNNQNIVTTISELDHDEHEGLDATSLLEHEEITRIKNIRNVVFGKYKMECWYFSPFPEEYYTNGIVDCLYFCEFTFRFFKTKNELIRYLNLSNLPRHPPGNEIYRDENVSMFELDGAVERIYCQNLCYFAKLFLDHKTLYWDVEPFLFYVLCTYDNRGFHPVGFFSKEKYSDLGYNLACILTFPSAQRKGYGRFLISFSYELSKKEEKIGSPEKPLSDLGAVSYKSYWASTLLTILSHYPGSSISILDLTRLTSILVEDVMATLHMLGLLIETSSSSLSAAGEGGEGGTILGLNNDKNSLIETTTAASTSRAGVDSYSSRASSPSLQSSNHNNNTASSNSHSSSSSSSSSYVIACPPDYLQSLMGKYPVGLLQVDSTRLHWAPLYVTDPRKDKWSLKCYTGLLSNS